MLNKSTVFMQKFSKDFLLSTMDVIRGKFIYLYCVKILGGWTIYGFLTVVKIYLVCLADDQHLTPDDSTEVKLKENLFLYFRESLANNFVFF